MIFLHPRYRIYTPSTSSLTVMTAQMVASKVVPDKVFVSDGPGYNLNAVPVCGIVFFN